MDLSTVGSPQNSAELKADQPVSVERHGSFRKSMVWDLIGTLLVFQ